MKQEYSIEGMKCAGCSSRLESAISKLEGVSECSVNLLTNSMTVETQLDSKEIIKAVKVEGFKAKVVKKNSNLDTSDEIIKKEIKRQIFVLVASVILSAPLIFLSLNGLVPICQMILSFLVMLLNYRFFVSGIRGLVFLKPNMDSLVSLGSLTSFIYSVATLLLGMGPECLYFDSAAMILTLITVGKLLESVSKGKTTDAIKALRSLAPKRARIIRDNETVEVSIDDIRPGDVFLVKTGEGFPADGEVLEGESFVDESSMTGESVLVKKSVGDEVFTSTINTGSDLICRASFVGEDTFLSKVIGMVADASSGKASIARFADRVAAIFVPVILLLALCTFGIWILISKEVGISLSHAISVLVVSCPCAMGLATPVAVMVGNGIAAGEGILFKTAEALEGAAGVKTVVFDKTGTITEGDIEHGDRLKEDSADAVKALKKMGLKVVMLSGDRRERALEIAEKVGIEEVCSQLLPGEKEIIVSSLMENTKVMMVGDGVNDAVALTRADVGVAIGCGKDVAIDSADVVLMNSSLRDVVKLIKISGATLRKIRINLVYAFAYNIVLVPMAAGALSGLNISMSPMLCALFMSLSSFLVVTNSLLLRLKKF